MLVYVILHPFTTKHLKYNIGSSKDEGKHKPWNCSTKGNDLFHNTNGGNANKTTKLVY